MNRAAAELSAFVSAERFAIVSEQQSRGPHEHTWAEVRLALRFSRGDSASVLLGRRTGSGRYLPEDIDALNRGAALITEQVERFRANELQRLVREAELRALQAQINPHFLFNALNTLYGIIGREAFEARRFTTLLKG